MLQTLTPISDILPTSALPLNGQLARQPRTVPGVKGGNSAARPADMSKACQTAHLSWRFQQRPREKCWLGWKVTGLRQWCWHLSQVQAKRGGSKNDKGTKTGQQIGDGGRSQYRSVGHRMRKRAGPRLAKGPLHSRSSCQAHGCPQDAVTSLRQR